MDQDRCKQLDAGLHDSRFIGHRQALVAWLESLSDVEECIAAALNRASEREDWETFERYLTAAFRHPSRSYTKVLCEVLSRHDEDLNFEYIVDVLAEIKDPESIDCLEQTIWWEPSWDDYRGLAKKAIWALSAIGTPEALDVLRDAATTESSEIREAAVEELRRAES
jgi:HEAT repeat protein